MLKLHCVTCALFQIQTELWCQGPFNNYVDRIFEFFDHSRRQKNFKKGHLPYTGCDKKNGQSKMLYYVRGLIFL